jgi:glycerophosphoryl diester phosphodiesterase
VRHILLSVALLVSGGLTSPGSPGLLADDPFASPVPVAHRGLFLHAPENTLPAFAACLDLRLGFEVDVRRSKDGHLVCVHDDTLKRTTGDPRKVADLTLAELRQLDAGTLFDPAFAGERVPALDEVFALAAGRKSGPALILLDLKVDDSALPADLAKLVNKHGLRERVVCIGLAIEGPDLRKRLKGADPQLPVAALAQKPEDLAAALKDEHSDWAYLRFAPTAEQVKAARGAGKRVVCVGPLFAGKEPGNWKKAAAAGVHAILTDYPLELRAAVRGKPGDRE